jgi:glutathione S-transferase
MIVVHHLNNSRSQRILWLLEELGLPYELKRYERDPKTMLAPPALRQVHPLGKSPVIEDDGLTLAESGAILDYLAHRYGGGRVIPPADTPQYLRYNYWLHYAEGSAMPPLLLKLVFDKVKSAPMPFFAKPVAKAITAGAMKAFIQPQIDTHLAYIEGELGKSELSGGGGRSAHRLGDKAQHEGLARQGSCPPGVCARAGARRRVRALGSQNIICPVEPAAVHPGSGRWLPP